MSRLTELLRRIEQQNATLAKELASEIKTLAARRSYGLNFERHVPESFELPGRKVRRKDKVRFRAPRRGSEEETDARAWLVTRIEGRGEARTAHLVDYPPANGPQAMQRPVTDLV